MTGVWVDRTLVVAATLLQVASVRSGSAAAPDMVLATIGSLAGLAGGLVLWFRRRALLAVLAGTLLAYVVQAAIFGPVLPVAVAVGCYTVARRDASWRGAGTALLGVLVIAVTVAVIGPASLAPTYAAALVVVVLAGALAAGRKAPGGDDPGGGAGGAFAHRPRPARRGRPRYGRDHRTGRRRTDGTDAGADADVRRALVTIEQAGRGVLREVRWLVGVLRERPERASSVTRQRWRMLRAAQDWWSTIDGTLEDVPSATARRPTASSRRV